MITSQPFNYSLPAEKIAQRPVYPYDRAKLLIVNRAQRALIDSEFSSIADFLRQDDLLIFNNSKVIPSRLFGKFASSDSSLEVLLLKAQDESDCWRAMGKPLKKFKAGVVLEFEAGLKAHVIERCGDYEVLLRFFIEGANEKLAEKLRAAACMPIPPYIREGRGDRQDFNDYQTCFAQIEGSIAAPTASLHFTPQLITKIKQHGCQIEFVTLHVGQASFLPVQKDEASGELKAPLAEECFIACELAQKITEARRMGRRVVAVGTTVVRALESVAQSDVLKNKTSLFIKPPYDFRWVDAIVTNFHQPGSTHLLLVQAFVGSQLLSEVYDYALTHQYRFLSYGDGMLIV